MKNLALGLMSGTSADGVSLALVRIGKPSGPPSRRVRVLAYATRPYPASLRGRILGAAKAAAPEICRLNFDLGRAFAGAARDLLRARRVSPKALAAAGTHGQTVIHLPGEASPSTLQVGEPSFLVEALGVPIVSDFRPRDMAAGGEGAPLVPFLDQYLFGDGPPRALQNIGGIGNVTLVGRGIAPIAFDTGPGNCLIDLAARRLTRGRMDYDKGGRLAAKGKADFRKARALLGLPYFRRKPPKSLDRTAFADEFLSRHFGRDLRSRPYDAVATLTCFTSLSIADSYKRFLFPRARVREAVVSGGGALNPVLMGWLRALLAPVEVRSIRDYGMHPLAKEPAAFALMAFQAIRGKINNVPDATGARGPRILGKITP